MTPSPDSFKQFVDGIVQHQNSGDVSCTNWESQGLQLVTTFMSSLVPLAIYVSINGPEYVFSYELSPPNHELEHALVILKLASPLSNSRPLLSQVNVVNIPLLTMDNVTDSKHAYEQIQNILSLVVVPYFDYTIQNDLVDLGSSSQASIGTKKKFDELAISLAYLRQRVQVPELLKTVQGTLLLVLRDPRAPEDENVLMDSALLNDLTRVVNGWLRQIQAVTDLVESRTDCISLLDEVQFWKSLEAGLALLQAQLTQTEIKNAIDILNSAKRFQVSLAFRNNLRLDDCLMEIKSFNALLRDLPIEEIVYKKETQLDIRSYDATVEALFTHLKRWKATSTFPVARMIHLMDQIVIEIVEHLTRILAAEDLFFLPANEFDQRLNRVITPLVARIEGNIRFMENIFRELVRKRQESFFVAKINQTALTLLKDRLQIVKETRLSYEQLQEALTCFKETTIAGNELAAAYSKRCAAAPVFEFSKEGASAWALDQRAYLQVRKKLERELAALVHRNLDECLEFTDYRNFFVAFTDSSAVLTLVVTLVDENHKIKVLDRARTEISQLLATQQPIVDAKTSVLSQFEDGLKRELSVRSKLLFYTDGLDMMLGHTWPKYSLGMKIQEEYNDVIELVELKRIFSSWISGATKAVSHLKSEAPLIRMDTNGMSSLEINDQSQVYVFLQQAQELLAFKFELSVSLIAQLDRLFVAQPYVRTLSEHVHLFRLLVSYVYTKPSFTEEALDSDFVGDSESLDCGYLLEHTVEQCTAALARVMNIKWADFYTELSLPKASGCLSLIADFQQLVSILDAQVSVLCKTQNYLNGIASNAVMSAPPNRSSLEAAIRLFQQQLVLIRRENFAHLSRYEATLNENLVKLLEKKCQKQLDGLVHDLQHGGSFAVHDINLEEEAVSLLPPLESTKESWYSAVNSILKTYNDLIGVSLSQRQELSLKSPPFLASVCSTLARLEDIYNDAATYWAMWEHFFQLSREKFSFTQSENISLDCSSWLKLVQEALQYREVFEASGGTHGIKKAIKFRFSPIQLRVLSLFSNFRSALLLLFLQATQNTSERVLENIAVSEKHLTALNSNDLVNSNDTKFLPLLAETFSLQSSFQLWASYILVHGQSQTLLRSHGSLPRHWIHTEQLSSKMVNVRAMRSARMNAIETHSDLLVLKVRSTWTATQEAIIQLRSDWQQQKPVAQDLEPIAAVAVLVRFLSLVKELDARLNLLRQIGTQLNADLPQPQETSSDISVEISALTTIWSELHGVWDTLNGFRTQPWSSASAVTIRRQLNDSMAQLHACSRVVRMYAAFTTLEQQINAFLLKVPLIAELKNAAVNERHWRCILARVAPCAVRESLTVGDILSLDLIAHETTIRSIVEQANGERAIEEALADLAAKWTTVVFETVPFSSTYRLVRNWKVLFDHCQNSLSTLVSIKSSPYCGPFEHTRDYLETQIGEFQSLLNEWVQVQSHWVYLHGVFGGSREMQSALPLEATRFHNVTQEYVGIYSRALGVSSVLDIVNIKNINTSLQQLFETLQNTKKGLLAYLDQQRDLFPRFFFVGNDDLLELLGCSSDVGLLNKHVALMFTGVGTLLFDESRENVTAVRSPQGEELFLSEYISLSGVRALAKWMATLERTIQQSVAASISDSTRKLSFLLETLQVSLNLKSDDLSEDLKFSISDLLQSPVQALVVAFQVHFTTACEASDDEKQNHLYKLDHILFQLKQLVLLKTETVTIAKTRSLIVELLHQQQVLSILIASQPKDQSALLQQQQLFYFDKTQESVATQAFPNKEPKLSQKFNLFVKHGRFRFLYGYEYLGIVDRLAMTPLVERCFLSMAQAITQNLGGSPFGPAGTGKTECIKALGSSLGRMVIVFCCDESFDYRSMARLMAGICRIGCWGCFDEFNRLDERLLSSVSALIEEIGTGRRGQTITLDGKPVDVHKDTGLFVTLNPNYAGRQELPENLKRLFRAFSMQRPDLVCIAEMLMQAHGFSHAHELSKNLVELMHQLEVSLSVQLHYDFGLRALKAVLTAAGLYKKSSDKLGGSLCNPTSNDKISDGEALEKHEDDRVEEMEEKVAVVWALHTVLAPKLTATDYKQFNDLVLRFFEVSTPSHSSVLKEAIVAVLTRKGYIVKQGFIEKTLQIIQLLNTHHGFMVLGSAGCGKSTLLDAALEAVSAHENTGFEKICIASKTLTKEQLFGALDPATREWSDGLFTQCIRRILRNLKGELHKRMWIVFDGDIDPEWAENLNSVLDDNRILTLPNGERLALPSNVRIVFEVDNLRAATPATVTRCGMVWIDSALVLSQDVVRKLAYDFRLSSAAQSDTVDDLFQREKVQVFYGKVADTAIEILQQKLLDDLNDFAYFLGHVMAFLVLRSLSTVFSYLSIYCDKYCKYDILDEQARNFATKALLLALAWAYTGDCGIPDRLKMSDYLTRTPIFAKLDAPSDFMNYKLVGFDVGSSLSWVSCASDFVITDLEPRQVLDPLLVIPTVDTVVHEAIIGGIVQYNRIKKNRALILCGPPGSGKTMTLLVAIRSIPDFELVSLNFCKDTTAETVILALEQHCMYRQTLSGLELVPRVKGKSVVVFCDELDLPSLDRFGAMPMIAFLRQLIEHGGFWRPRDRVWVSLVYIQFVGACNGPSEPGRNILSERFMRFVTLILVEHPSESGMRQIYYSLNSAVLKCAPDLGHYARPMTDAMLEVYSQTRAVLAGVRSHYVYSPRELTRWCRGILRTLMAAGCNDINSLVNIWHHEGIRLFCDRLVEIEEKKKSAEMFQQCAQTHFRVSVLEHPPLFSSWLSGTYQEVSREPLAKFVRERMRVFCEEELDASIVVHGALLDHVLRIDRVLRQPQGHMMVVGASGSGKSTLVRFVAWANGLSLLPLRVRRGYTVQEFEKALRAVLRGCAQGTRICFLMDESCLSDTAFVERINLLLANCEVPGLFEGEELDSLYALCATEASALGLVLDGREELHSWFTRQVADNLHVVFTVSEVGGFQSSPALFNRCVVDWIGNWESETFLEVAFSLLDAVPFDISDYVVPELSVTPQKITSFRDAVVKTVVAVHDSAKQISHLDYPSKFLSFLRLTVEFFFRYYRELEANQRCVGVGLEKLKETAFEVARTEEHLQQQRIELAAKVDRAKQMLNQMILDQNEAERKKEFSEEAQIQLQKQEREIRARRDSVVRSLQAVEPAVLEAQRGVQNIKKQHLTEIRSMLNPPAAVKMTMESVCILLGYPVSTWRDVQQIVRKDDFITSIVRYDSEKHLSTEMKSYMEQQYLSRNDYTFEAVNRASQACGPLVQWVVAQLRYFAILEQVGPLRAEVAHLEESATQSRARLIAIGQMIEELEASIESYKNEYSEVIGQVETTKAELARTEQKVVRSKLLVASLTTERARWADSVRVFEQSRARLAGHSVLGAAYATYCGGLSAAGRTLLYMKWIGLFDSMGIPYERGLPALSHLPSAHVNSSSKDDKLESSKNKLLLSADAAEADTAENLAIMATCRIPLVIDPAESYLRGKTCSFLDGNFLGTLADTLRFGGSLVVENAEQYDPIMDAYVRNDVTTRGGQKILQLANNSTVVLPACSVVLHTRDERCKFLPFLQARVTLVRFGVSEGNLENAVVNTLLSHCSPEVYERRTQVVHLQSQYHSQILHLRESLLAILNECSGTMLEDDHVIRSLEQLQEQATETDTKMAAASTTLAEFDKTRNMFVPVAEHVRSIYLVLLSVSALNGFYNFSWQLFFSAFQSAVDVAGSGEFDETLFIKLVYAEIFSAFAPCFNRLDRVAFSLALVLVYCSLQIGLELSVSMGVLREWNESQWIKHLNLSLFDSISQFDESWRSQLTQTGSAFSRLLPFIDYCAGTTLKSAGALEAIAAEVFDVCPEFSLDWNALLSLNSPVLFSTLKRYDVSYKIQAAAKALNKNLLELSMGSQESVCAADRAIRRAYADGGWVLLQNVQLSPVWLIDLERFLTENGNRIDINEQGSEKLFNFKLFLTCSLDSLAIPNGLIQLSSVVTIEEQPSFKVTLQETFSRLCHKNQSGLHNHVCLLLSVYNAVIQERLKYVPLSFSQAYDINDADIDAAAFVVLTIFHDTAGDVITSGSTISGGSLPWTELAFRIGQVLIGGKMNDSADVAYCADLAAALFSAKSLDSAFNFFDNPVARRKGLTHPPPTANSTEAMNNWVALFPNPLPLAYIGLEEDVVDTILGRDANEVVEKVFSIIPDK